LERRIPGDGVRRDCNCSVYALIRTLYKPTALYNSNAIQHIHVPVSFQTRGGPVTHSTPDPDTVILTCDRSLKWPALIGLAALVLLVLGEWVLGFSALIAVMCFAMLRVDVVISKKNATLELRPMLAMFRFKRRTRSLTFSQIREFLVESEFTLDGSKPFVWHLTAVTVDGTYHRLTWHFARQPIFRAGEEAARITGKPLREEPDPFKSSTWSHWGYNFLR
jgi:hypothetical protein